MIVDTYYKNASIIVANYHEKLWVNDDNELVIYDHLNGFDQTKYSSILDSVVNQAMESNINTIITGYIFNESIKNQYPNINFKYQQEAVGGRGWEGLSTHLPTNIKSEKFKNFLCSFNHAPSIGRHLLLAMLGQFELFDPDYCSKHFTISKDSIDGHVYAMEPINNRYYRKFLINFDDDFGNIISEFGDSVNSTKLYNNMPELISKLTDSFVHLVSETLATSYYPFVTEKFLYSIVTKGLFVSYAHPGWHNHIEQYSGFKLYRQIFDYRFDLIESPIERLIALITMLLKFSKLPKDDLYDLYLMEKDTIDYNYDHYISGDYLKLVNN